MNAAMPQAPQDNACFLVHGWLPGDEDEHSSTLTLVLPRASTRAQIDEAFAYEMHHVVNDLSEDDLADLQRRHGKTIVVDSVLRSSGPIKPFDD